MSNYAVIPNTNVQPTQVRTQSETAAAELVNKALAFLAKPSGFVPDNDADLRPICKAIAEREFTDMDDVFKTLGSIAKKQDNDETWKLVRRIFSKVMGCATRDLFYKIRSVERKQEKARRSGIELAIGEIETYTYPANEKDPYTVAEYHDAVEEIKAKVDQWNDVITMLLGWGQESTADGDIEMEFAIPYCWVLKAESVGKAGTDEEDYEPAYTLNAAFIGLGRAEDAKANKRKEAARGMLDALLGDLAA